MNIFDIILGIPLILAAIMGFRGGLVVQLGGIIGLVAGIYLAFRFGSAVGEWIGAEGVMAEVAGFAIVLLLAVIVLTILGHATKGLFRFAGLGALDSVGGLLFGVVKMGLLLSVLLVMFETLNDRQHWVTPEQTEGSYLYEPVRKVADMVFPYIEFVKDRMLL